MPIDIPNFYPDDSGLLFDSMVEGMDTLFVIDTPNVDVLAKQLTTYHSFTGRVAYHWHAESGLKRFDLPHITLPRTNQLLDAIYHVANSQHFGIYLFTGFEDELQKPMALNLLNYFLRSSHVVRKFMIFAGNHPIIPTEMEDDFTALRLHSAEAESEEFAERNKYLY